MKLRKYAEAGIPHCWCIEDEDGAPVVHVYERDEPTGAYAPAGIFRGTLQRPVPFEISLDLDKPTPPRHVEAERSAQSSDLHKKGSGSGYPAPIQHGASSCSTSSTTRPAKLVYT